MQNPQVTGQNVVIKSRTPKDPELHPPLTPLNVSHVFGKEFTQAVKIIKINVHKTQQQQSFVV
jgi:hypothetical protein